ncbi:malate dehydrogenase, partial [Escherichia coli]|nr:malate dehydrogenase [Escherichia coli]
RQLKKRHDGRATIEINDEYDVQDLVHALLTLHFDDIRPEEGSPSFAGSSSRQDFLLKKEKIVIEVKKTRRSLGANKIGEELLIDMARY